MKVKTLALISTVALLSAASYAQDNRSRYDRAEDARNGHERGEGGGKAGPGHHRPGRRGGDAEKIIERLDANEDGLVDEVEFLDSRLDRIDHTFERRDADGDGLISREEAERRRHDRPEIDREEVILCVRKTIADWEGPGEIDDRFDAVDLNNDNFIDLAELSTALEQRAYVLFDRIDTDGNGYISLEELQASQDVQINVRRVIRHCIQELSDPFESAI